MTYTDIRPGVFLRRPNRFVAHVQAGRETLVCHVKNTGRLGELLLPGAPVFVQRAQNPNRKTLYDLISVYKGDELVNIDSAAPNKAFAEWATRSGFFGAGARLRAEARFGASRLDFYIEAASRKTWVEVKGVTLEEEGLALFPDAPTQRGVRHLEELVQCRKQGYDAAAVFVVQMKGCRAFAPNRRTHPAFADALANAAAHGVQVLALDCRVAPNSLAIEDALPVRLGI